MIALVMAIALPSFMPMLEFSSFEAAARHLANYGRAAMNYAMLMHERLTVQIDLENGEYWAVKWVVESDGLFEDEQEGQQPADQSQQFPALAGALAPGSPEEAALKAQEMQDKFDRFARLMVETRAKNVHQEGILDEIDPLFDHEFKLDSEDEEDQRQEVQDPLLVRTYLPEGVVIDSVRIGSTSYSQGTVEVDITPLGLGETVVFYLRNDQGEYYTTLWDPIAGSARFFEGKEELDISENE